VNARSRIGSLVVGGGLLLAGCSGHSAGQQVPQSPPPPVEVTRVAPIVGVPKEFYPSGRGRTWLLGDGQPWPGELPASELHFLIETNGGVGDVYWEVSGRAADKFLAAPSGVGFFTEGERWWIVRVDLDSEFGCLAPRRIRRLTVSARGRALGAYTGPPVEGVARITYRGDCDEGTFRFVQAERFDPSVQYWRD